ncbi:MAG: hypothetical protein EBQ51_08070 [Verrucomicrobia bacterium]|nr:hypothetical protein [Pseudomonadota bacterium]NBS06180.1 hypothetical protein [Verrucomicrobiota bacterium]NBS78314.1 hypothetical protein [bacterium]NBS50991.1 hypothetical protein [Verrucomicrobiota bacterium]NBT24569.1 hypothetical protein [bacterium]
MAMRAEEDLMKQRVRQWQRASPELEKIRQEEIRCADTSRAMKFLQGSVRAELKFSSASPTSGLVEQQRYFLKLRT